MNSFLNSTLLERAVIYIYIYIKIKRQYPTQLIIIYECSIAIYSIVNLASQLKIIVNDYESTGTGFDSWLSQDHCSLKSSSCNRAEIYTFRTVCQPVRWRRNWAWLIVPRAYKAYIVLLYITVRNINNLQSSFSPLKIIFDINAILLLKRKLHPNIEAPRTRRCC